MSLDADSTPATAIVNAGVAQGPDPGGEQLVTTPAAVDEPPVHDTADKGSDKPSSEIECVKPPEPTFLHSPPDSNNANKSTASDSELSDLEDEPLLDCAAPPAVPETQAEQPAGAKLEEEEEDIGEVLPDEWSGKVPIFRPTWYQFKDFKKFMKKVDSYGMKSGIIKIIPPKEWKDAQPPLDELVKQIRVREPIKQDIMGSNGTYRQVNILHGRSYNVPQWRQLCEQSEHQPPARRGERRVNADKPKPARPKPAPKSANPTTPKKRGRGRPPKNKGKKSSAEDAQDRPMTPVSPKVEDTEGPEQEQRPEEQPITSIEEATERDEEDDGEPAPIGRMGGVKLSKGKTQSVSARRKYSRREGSAAIDEEAFKGFDYQMDVSEYTAERCEELERAYWKTLTYAQPLYGADMMGTLFDDRTETWNLNKLPNLLDVLGSKIPGVNTAYLYLGMWKATFAWHLEDVDLYSINYLHFGAPKQWYSISQADARRFEGAMRSVWPQDAKACSQFLRHKGFLISPHHLQQHYGIKVNKVLSYPGEFVVTYPYGYHSGYNLGYNCAEAVNFALDTWLEMGKIAKRCECAQAQDSVWINVYEIERKLRGEETEYEETDEDEDDEDDDDMSGLPTPPASHVKFKDGSRKRKRGHGDKLGRVRVKKLKLKFRTKADPPCCLCPNDIPQFELLPTEDGRKAHRLCALYIPETYIDTIDGKEVVCDSTRVHKDRLELKCLFCRSKRGACFQCSQKKCARAYHATCAAAAGVFVEDQDVPVFGEDGTEYKEQAFEFSCRFHRSKRDKRTGAQVLEADKRIRSAAKALEPGDVCQLQYLRGDIFAGVVAENRSDEETLLISVLPTGDRIEVEWKWLLLPDESDYHLPKASANALPLPASRQAKDRLNAKRAGDDKPRKDDQFAEGYTWAEFNSQDVTNPAQTKIDFAKTDQIWHYLGKTSTEAKAQYTEDPAQPRHNPKGNFLDTVPKPPRPSTVPKAPARQSQFHASSLYAPHTYGFTGTFAASGQANTQYKPYVYKSKQQTQSNQGASGMYTAQRFVPYQVPAQQYQNTQVQQQQIPQQALSQGPQGSTYDVPSASTPPSSQVARTSYQVHSSVYQKYQFFQVNHNRDESRYRTPYSTRGGFTNRYEGDIRTVMVPKQGDVTNLDRVAALSNAHSQIPRSGAQPAPTLATAQQPPTAEPTTPIRTETETAAPVAPRMPAKVSPVPLPPHVLAAMAASSRSTSASPLRDKTGTESEDERSPVDGSAEQRGQDLPPSHLPNPPVDSEQPMYLHTSHPQEFADVPGCESMRFVERMMQNLRRASSNEGCTGPTA